VGSGRTLVLSMHEDNSSEEARAAPVLLRRKWVIVGTTAVVFLAAMLLTGTQTPAYTSHASVLVDSTLDQTTSSSVNMADEKQVAGSVAVANLVIDELGLSAPPLEVLKNLSINVPVDSNILTISYTGPSPRAAKRMADAFLQAYIDFRQQGQQEALDSALASIRHQIALLTAQLGRVEDSLSSEQDPNQRALDTSRASALIAQIGTLEERAASLVSPEQAQLARILNAASLPTSVSTPSYPVNAAVGLMAGLVLGLVAALVLDRIDDRVRSREDVETRLGAPVLGVIPRMGPKDLGPLVAADRPSSPEAEAYKQLRADLRVAASRSSARAILVTSSRAGEGKTVAVANLAVTLARGGQRVILVSADLRTPDLDRLFGRSDGPGLVDVLMNGVSLERAIQETSIADLRLLQSGTPAADPYECLASPGLSRVLRDLRRMADVVLVDSAPLLAVADPAMIAPECDAVLFVADAQSASRKDLVESRHQLERMQTQVLGGVLMNAATDAGRLHLYHHTSRSLAEPNGSANRSAQPGSNGSSEAIGSTHAPGAAEAGPNIRWGGAPPPKARAGDSPDAGGAHED
jgi:tyrosine-protein kinase